MSRGKISVSQKDGSSVHMGGNPNVKAVFFLLYNIFKLLSMLYYVHPHSSTVATSSVQQRLFVLVKTSARDSKEPDNVHIGQAPIKATGQAENIGLASLRFLRFVG